MKLQHISTEGHEVAGKQEKLTATIRLAFNVTLRHFPRSDCGRFTYVMPLGTFPCLLNPPRLNLNPLCRCLRNSLTSCHQEPRHEMQDQIQVQRGAHYGNRRQVPALAVRRTPEGQTFQPNASCSHQAQEAQKVPS